MALGLKIKPFSGQRILLAHSNEGATAIDWHERRRQAASTLGYDVTLFSTANYCAHAIFPKVDRRWRRRDKTLMRMYDALGPAIAASDLFIHYNGAMIHPEFLQQFSTMSVYHCADDPDASRVISQPVARYYDMCAISNAACIEMYRRMGCKHVFFWPLGSFSHVETLGEAMVPWSDRNIPLLFIGSKRGVSNVRYVGRFLGLYRKERFMRAIQRAFPDLIAYGAGWQRGFVSDRDMASLYGHARVGFNVHNSLGPINGRLYDLAAYGVCQVCDNKANLNLVFEEGREIIGFTEVDECIDLIRYYLAHPEAAEQIGRAGRARYMRDYTMSAIWQTFIANVNRVSCGEDA